MEGKAMIFKAMANIDAIPVVLATQTNEEIIATIRNNAPGTDHSPPGPGAFCAPAPSASPAAAAPAANRRTPLRIRWTRIVTAGPR